ncbi:septum formation inhibitor Maf [Nonlabens sp. SY33080]|uniref:septum formation inhibitor Maf n=1 Tax=Nonlabens sp. SY33080 TaxID=2719911 RepID=UPI001428CFDE|nr:septum formation inhibitor Maf [Nonlabens sp. SY33080]
MKFFYLYVLVATLISCQTDKETSTTDEVSTPTKSKRQSRSLDENFKSYWFDGTAEISSYELNQARYGEMRQGTAVLIYVTEPFDSKDQIKADRIKDDNYSVLKLNATRDFNTGIYPYKMMSSTFLPLDFEGNSIKVAASIQEWCGHTYMQFNENNTSYDVQLHSYFQSEGNKSFQIESALLENQIPSQLRLGPLKMPVDTLNIVPSAEFLRLKHIDAEPMEAIAKLRELPDGYLYSVNYPEINRTIAYKTEKEFPFRILNWMERYMDNQIPMVSTASLKKTIKTDYWNKNSNKFAHLRDSLQL